MFNKILVAIDRSPVGKYVFTAALSLAKVSGAKLMLLNVLSPYEEDYPYSPFIEPFNYLAGKFDDSLDMYLEKLEQFKQEGLDLLNLYTKEALNIGINTEFIQIPGNPGNVICEVATNNNVDLIVIGYRGHSPWQELLLGSVSNYVSHHAKCSVFTIHPEMTHTVTV